MCGQERIDVVEFCRAAARDLQILGRAIGAAHLDRHAATAWRTRGANQRTTRHRQTPRVPHTPPRVIIT